MVSIKQTHDHTQSLSLQRSGRRSGSAFNRTPLRIALTPLILQAQREPRLLKSHVVLQLQTTLGNRLVTRLLTKPMDRSVNFAPTHIEQSSNSSNQIQRTPAATPASAQDRREFIEATSQFFRESADYYRDIHVTLDQSGFERLINDWYLMAVDREGMINQNLGNETLLRRELRSAYIAAIRILIKRAATVVGKSEADLYRENRGRIPMWAWQTPHQQEPRISTPITQGRSTDPLSGEVGFTNKGFQVTIVPDTTDINLGNRAETRINFIWGQLSYVWQHQGRKRIILSFTGPGIPSVRIQTFYGSRVTASSPSGYGRGTTVADIAGGKVTPYSTSLGFHEGSHGLDYVEYLENNPSPSFTGRIGMTQAQFRATMRQWENDCRAYERRIKDFTTKRTDCVGTTIDRFTQTHSRPGTRVKIECRP